MSTNTRIKLLDRLIQIAAAGHGNWKKGYRIVVIRNLFKT